MAKQNVILENTNTNSKKNKKFDITTEQETNFVELSTSQGGKVLVTIGISSSNKPIGDIITEAVAAYQMTIRGVGVKFAVANEPINKTEISTSAKGFPQVTISGEGDLKIAERYNEVVKNLIVNKEVLEK